MKRVIVFILLAITSAGVSAALLSGGSTEEGAVLSLGYILNLILNNSLVILLITGFVGLLAARRQSSAHP